MSSSIWTQCAGDSELRPLRLSPWRVVEAQHQVSTRKLVDSDDEQILLEELIDRVKPSDMTSGRLHYLLFTPFRYPPLRHGSRFGKRHERGIWYGSLELRSSFAEIAYYRLLFLEGTEAALDTITVALTAFSANVKTMRGIDLTRAPFDSHRAELSSPVRYRESQTFGSDMRAARVEAFLYYSARDAEDGVNVGVLDPSAFGRSRPRGFETWHCSATRARVDFSKGDYFDKKRFTFLRAQFLVGGRLPHPAI